MCHPHRRGSRSRERWSDPSVDLLTTTWWEEVPPHRGLASLDPRSVAPEPPLARAPRETTKPGFEPFNSGKTRRMDGLASSRVVT